MQYVITGVRSRTHLIHIAAYLRARLRDTDDSARVAFIGGGRFLGNSTVTEQDVRQALPHDDRLSIEFPTGQQRWSYSASDLTYLSVGVPGIKPWANLKRNGIRTKVHVVVTDEGLGTYGDRRTRLAALARQGTPQPWRSVRATALHAANRTLTGTRWAMYRKDDGWSLNPDIAQEFRSLVDNVAAQRDSRVVFLTQPWVELGVLDDDRYLAHINEVAGAVRAEGLDLAIRPHPAEDATRYRDFEVLDAAFTAEADPTIVNAAGIVGGTSTALLNLAALYDLPAARLIVPELAHLEDELGEDQRALLNTYLPPAVEPARWRGLTRR